MKRRIVLAAIFLLAGAVVNVAVAWGCAVSIRRSKPASPPVWALLREVAPDGSWHSWGIERIKLRGALFFMSFCTVSRLHFSPRTEVSHAQSR